MGLRRLGERWCRWHWVPRPRGPQLDGKKGGFKIPTTLTHQLPPETKSSLTLSELDKLLDQLAAPSPYSQLSIPPVDPPDPVVVLRQLFRDSNLSPNALGVLVQIIMRDLRPLLCPLPTMRTRHPTAMLRLKITAAPQPLNMHLAMWCWNPVMARLYRDGKGDIDWCADAAESVSSSPGQVIPVPPGPVLGVNVQVR